jgi:MerR family copper efflux transcriptional regulator
MEGLTTGQVAREAGVKTATVRYYERRGLIPRPPRGASGYRLYPPDTARRIRLVRHARQLGFTLGEISDLLAPRLAPGTLCLEIKRRAERKAADIEGRLQSLQRMRDALSVLAASCRGSGPVRECPIPGALDKDLEDIVSMAVPGERRRKGGSL